MKGQASLEFLIYSAVFLLVLLGAFVLINSIQKVDVRNKDSLYVRLVGERHSTAIDYAMVMPENMLYKIDLEKDVFGDYEEKIYFSNGRYYLYINATKNNKPIYYSFPLDDKNIRFGRCINFDNEGNAIINTKLGNLVFVNTKDYLIIYQEGC